MITPSSSAFKEKCLQSIEQLFLKYENDNYMTQRIQSHVITYLPNTLENELKNHEKRVNRNMFLTNEQQIFIQVFLSKNQFYYLPNNNYFYEYDGNEYTIVKEDDVIHKLLSSISKDRTLLDWKHKTKFNVIKQIKERSILNSMPETETIQNVLNVLYPHVFTTKNEAKYFLTILGDNILRKNANLIFLVSPKVKAILAEIDVISHITIGFTNTTNNFVTKYHENYAFENCRLLKINENFSIEVWKEILKKSGLNLVCVAAHYSNRYENSDNYLDTKADEELKNYSYYLKNTNQLEVVTEFTSKCFQVVSTEGQNKIEWKNIHFIWKQFLSKLSLPSMIYSNTLKTMLKDIYSFDESTDSFLNIASKYLKIESDFIKFWDATISKSPISSEELELDEICMLFKYWVKNEKDNESSSILSGGNISEEYVLKVIKHFFPDVEVVEEKFILNISCSMWDKVKDIKKSFTYIKDDLITQTNYSALISFDEAYNYYFKFCNTKSYKFIISKKYFEKYLYSQLAEHIVYEKFIETEFFVGYFI
jgi:hypothetical protein